MELFVNGNKLDITLENEKTIGEVLKSFEEECEKNNATTIQIILNGKNIDADHFDEACSKPISDETKIELTVVYQEEIKNALKSEEESCNSLSEKLLELSAQLQTGKDKEASLLISSLADLIDRFCRTATLSSLFPEFYNKILIDGKNLNDFFADFSPILNDFEQAIASKDVVLMGDLAEYEISPRLLMIANMVKDL